MARKPSPSATFDPSATAERVTAEAFETIPSRRGRRTKSKFSQFIANLKPGTGFTFKKTAEISKNLMQSARSAAKSAGFDVDLKTNPDGDVVVFRPKTDAE